jgi:hypothetical protein
LITPIALLQLQGLITIYNNQNLPIQPLNETKLTEYYFYNNILSKHETSNESQVYWERIIYVSN